MTVASIMTPRPVTLGADDSVGRALQLMLERRHLVLPIVDADGRYAGMFDVWNLLQMMLPPGTTSDDLMPDLAFMGDDLPGLRAKIAAFRDRPVGPLARRDLLLLRPKTPIVEAVLLFHRHRRTLPVVEEATGRLVGVLSYWDALTAVAGPTP